MSSASTDRTFEATPDVTIGPDPHRPGRHLARLIEYGVPVWALIAHLQGNEWDAVRTAEDYTIPEAAVKAAIAYYEADATYIDAFLLLNDDFFSA